MKIALLNTLYAPYEFGGAERSVQILAEALAGRGHNVSVVTCGESHLERRSVVNGVTVYRVAHFPYSSRRANAAARAARHLMDLHNRPVSAAVGEILDHERPDLLHTHVLAGFSVGVWGEAARRGIPVVQTLRDYYLMCPLSTMYRNAANCERICPRCSPFAAYRRRATQAVHGVSGISRFILDRHIRAGFFENSTTASVIFNPLPVARPCRTRRPGRTVVFGYIGRICVEKGVEWLLEVFTAHGTPGDRLLVAGSKGDPGFVEGLQRRFSSFDSVSFLGHVDPATFYDQVDVVVIPSLWNEPFGRTAIEPLAHGVPVIASSRGGLPEIVQDGVTGLLVDPAEPGALARAMRRLSAAPRLLEHLAGNCQQRLAQFSEGCITEAYERLYSEVLARPASGVAALPARRGPPLPQAKA